MIQQVRKRTQPEDIVYSFYTSTAVFHLEMHLSNIRFVTKSHTDAIRDWIQKYKPKRLSYNKTKISLFIIDEKFNSKLVLN